jgi:hypothetical protein
MYYADSAQQKAILPTSHSPRAEAGCGASPTLSHLRDVVLGGGSVGGGGGGVAAASGGRGGGGGSGRSLLSLHCSDLLWQPADEEEARLKWARAHVSSAAMPVQPFLLSMPNEVQRQSNINQMLTDMRYGWSSSLTSASYLLCVLCALTNTLTLENSRAAPCRRVGALAHDF